MITKSEKLQHLCLQYISCGSTTQQQLDNIENACKAGVRWIQLRVKNTAYKTHLEIALETRRICDTYNSIFIVNDTVNIAKESHADGVHLGLNDTNPKKAREILGNNTIIGGTANTYLNLQQHTKDDVDYMGLGPYRFTKTKEKLSPILGVSGYKSILTQYQASKITKPVVAIGGIQMEDIPELIKTPIQGIAVSRLLTQTNNEINLSNRVNTLYNLLKKDGSITNCRQDL